MAQRTPQIIAASDGIRTSVEIAALVGASPRYVRKVQLRKNLPRCAEGAQPGRKNHQFVSGRRIDLDGYVLVTAPAGHPYARKRKGRQSGLILEHRLVMERKLGRYLLPQEVVDHIDGLTLHNAPENLRLFASNNDHLGLTLSGRRPDWSEAGYQRMKIKRRQHASHEPVDMHHLRRARGDVRLRQILLAALKLGIDSPFLSGTRRHLQKARIDASSRPTIELALRDLYGRWGSRRAR